MTSLIPRTAARLLLPLLLLFSVFLLLRGHHEPGGAPLELGTPLLFDVGVYLAVLGVTLTIVLSLAEEEG